MRKRYSHLITPLLVTIDLLIINCVIFFVNDRDFLNAEFLLFVNLFWIIISFFSNFYKVYRFTQVYRVFSLLFVHLFLFTLVYFAYFGIFREGAIVNNQFKVLMSIIIGISVLKLLSFYALKLYRKGGKNFRNVVIIGQDNTSLNVARIFIEEEDLGYNYHGYFSDSFKKNRQYLGTLDDSYDYIIDHNIDEIYCTVSELKKEQVKDFTKFANRTSRIIKLIPNSNELYSKNLRAEYYSNTLVLNVNRLPLDLAENKVIKRFFDIIFSLFVIVFLLSWLSPIIALLIKLESKGPALFKQEREGLGGYHFICYKFRSMRVNKESETQHAKKNDERITKFGAFLRKTSLDELPQFFNVLKGDMSVVGPRPHISSFSEEYQKEIDNYMERHAVKPGITGLAQVTGYRGEVAHTSDIINRVRFDIFYIENWSLLLDFRIIIQTILNVFKGEEKAY